MTAPAGLPPPAPWRLPLAAAACLFAALAALYWPALEHPLFFLDDRGYTSSPLVAGGVTREGVRRAFAELPPADLYIPVTQLSFMADVELFGASPRVFHRTNVLLHGASAALLLLVLWRATGRPGESAFAAALAALHPMRVESVAWVAERKDVLSFLFLVLSLACHLRFARTGRGGWYAALLLCAALGMLAKPTLVTLPLLLLLLDGWPLGRFRGAAPGGEGGGSSPAGRAARLVLEKLPLLLLSGAVSLVTLHVQRGGGSVHGAVPLPERLGHALAAPLVYLYQTFFPAELVFRGRQPAWDRFEGLLLPAGAALLLATAAVLLLGRRRPYLAFGWLWFLAALVPASGIVPSGGQWISDRFTYVPHAGLAVACAWGASAALPAGRSRALLPIPALLLLLLLAGLSRRQLSFWKDGATLVGRGLAQNAEDLGYRNLYAEELLAAGELARAREQLDRLLPYVTDPVTGRRIQAAWLELLDRSGDRAGTEESARRFLARDPGSWRTRLRLGDALLARESWEEAAAEFRRVLPAEGLPPADRGYALEGLGLALAGAGRRGEALAAFREGVLADPAAATLHFHLARALEESGLAGEAAFHFREAARLDPSDPRFRTGSRGAAHPPGGAP